MKIIKGRHNGDPWEEYYWVCPEPLFEKAGLGDYAIVENKEGFAMVEIVLKGEAAEGYRPGNRKIYKHVLGWVRAKDLEKQREEVLKSE